MVGTRINRSHRKNTSVLGALIWMYQYHSRNSKSQKVPLKVLRPLKERASPFANIAHRTVNKNDPSKLKAIVVLGTFHRRPTSFITQHERYRVETRINKHKTKGTAVSRYTRLGKLNRRTTTCSKLWSMRLRSPYRRVKRTEWSCNHMDQTCFKRARKRIRIRCQHCRKFYRNDRVWPRSIHQKLIFEVATTYICGMYQIRIRI